MGCHICRRPLPHPTISEAIIGRQECPVCKQENELSEDLKHMVAKEFQSEFDELKEAVDRLFRAIP